MSCISRNYASVTSLNVVDLWLLIAYEMSEDISFFLLLIEICQNLPNTGPKIGNGLRHCSNFSIKSPIMLYKTSATKLKIILLKIVYIKHYCISIMNCDEWKKMFRHLIKYISPIS